jgi:hypothetical protein
MDDPEDRSIASHSFPTSQIISIMIKDPQESVQDGYPFVLDFGKTQLHLNCVYRFEMVRWVEALVISMQTTREGKTSLMNANKNVSKLICQYDIDKEKLVRQWQKDFSKKLPLEIDEWEFDVDHLLQ